MISVAMWQFTDDVGDKAYRFYLYKRQALMLKIKFPSSRLGLITPGSTGRVSVTLLLLHQAHPTCSMRAFLGECALVCGHVLQTARLLIVFSTAENEESAKS